MPYCFGRLLGVVLALVAFSGAVPSPAQAGQRHKSGLLSGDYVVVAIRRASDVRSMPDTDAHIEKWLGSTVSFGHGLVWADGTYCDRWSDAEVEGHPLTLEDPNLSDLAIEPLEPPAHHVFAFVKSMEVYCDDGGAAKRIASLIRVDDRILVTPSPSGAFNIILEKPLSAGEARRLQAQLKDMKFYSGGITGEMDEKTRAAVSSHAEYRGAQYRFKNAAITVNLLDKLKILERAWTPGEMGAEAARYRFRGLKPAGEPQAEDSVVAVLSEFFEVGKYWVDLDRPGEQGAPEAVARGDEIAVFLSELPRLEYSVLGYKVQLIETERSGDWDCVMAKGCYPKGHVVGIADIPRDLAGELCEMFRLNGWFCAIVKP